MFHVQGFIAPYSSTTDILLDFYTNKAEHYLQTWLFGP